MFQVFVEDDLLREIASADYGVSADLCHSLLRQFLQTGALPPDGLSLLEVLELTRWTRPPRWTQLFAATALVQLGFRYPEHVSWEFENLAPLVLSAIELSEPAARAAVSMLAHRFLAYPGENEAPPFFAFAILLLAVHIGGDEDRGPWLAQLGAWVEAEEFRARDDGFSQPEWLLGLHAHSQHEGLWRHLARRILLSPASPHPSAANATLRRLGALVAGPDY